MVIFLLFFSSIRRWLAVGNNIFSIIFDKELRTCIFEIREKLFYSYILVKNDGENVLTINHYG